MSSLEQYIKERAKWKSAGKPIRSEKKIRELHNICKKCPHFIKGGGFVPGYDKCDLCGCNLHNQKATLNKLAWGTTECPDNPPQWGPEAPES